MYCIVLCCILLYFIVMYFILLNCISFRLFVFYLFFIFLFLVTLSHLLLFLIVSIFRFAGTIKQYYAPTDVHLLVFDDRPLVSQWIKIKTEDVTIIVEFEEEDRAGLTHIIVHISL